VLEIYKSKIKLFSELLRDDTLSVKKRNASEAKLATAQKNLDELLPRINE